MSSTTSTTPTPVTDEQLVVDLTAVRDAAKRELEELEPRRAALVARIAALESTIGVYSGETPTPAPKRTRAKHEPGQPTVREQRAAAKAAREAAAAASAETPASS
jgi:cell division protein FtsB